MKKIIVLKLLFTTILLAQQQVDIPWPTLANSDWPMIAHDPQITGRSPFSGPKTAAIKWTVDLPYGVFSGPIIGEDGTLYVGTRSYLGFAGDTTNYFYAIDPKSGEIKWTFLTGDPHANESGYLINNEGKGLAKGRLGALEVAQRHQVSAQIVVDLRNVLPERQHVAEQGFGIAPQARLAPAQAAQ